MPQATSRFSKLLLRDYHTEKIDYQEIQDVMGVSYSQVRRLVAGDIEARVDWAISWCDYRQKLNDNRYSLCFVPHPESEITQRIYGTANGKSEDEITAAVHSLSGYDSGIKNGDTDKVSKAIGLLKTKIIPNMEAEFDRMAGSMEMT